MLLSRRNPTIENRQPANHPPITHLRLYTASTRIRRHDGRASRYGRHAMDERVLGMQRELLRPREIESIF